MLTKGIEDSRAGAPSQPAGEFKRRTDGILEEEHLYGPKDLSDNAGLPVVIPRCLRLSDRKPFLFLVSDSVVVPLPCVACTQGPRSVLILAGPHKFLRRWPVPIQSSRNGEDSPVSSLLP